MMLLDFKHRRRVRGPLHAPQFGSNAERIIRSSRVVYRPTCFLLYLRQVLCLLVLVSPRECLGSKSQYEFS